MSLHRIIDKQSCSRVWQQGSGMSGSERRQVEAAASEVNATQK
jgi:hypothetical protein